MSETAAELVERYFKLDNHISEQQNKFKEYLKPFAEEIEAIKSKLLGMLNEQGIENIRTDHGTAYKSIIDTPKIENHEAYLDWCLEFWDAIGSEMLQIGAPKKDAVRQYMEANGGHLPPNVSMTSFTRLNIRRS